MKQERLQELLGRLEKSPDMPLMILTDHEALEAAEAIRRTHPGAKLLVMRGIRYVTITEEAVQRVLEQLARERRVFAKTVEKYDKEIADIQDAVEKGKRYYWSPESTSGPPAFADK